MVLKSCITVSTKSINKKGNMYSLLSHDIHDHFILKCFMYCWAKTVWSLSLLTYQYFCALMLWFHLMVIPQKIHIDLMLVSSCTIWQFSILSYMGHFNSKLELSYLWDSIFLARGSVKHNLLLVWLCEMAVFSIFRFFHSQLYV